MFLYTPGRNCDEAEALKATIEALQDGGVAIFPTDTVYGIGLVVSQYPDGPEPLFEIKERPHEKKIPLLLPSIDALGVYGRDISPQTLALAKTFWPGGLTLVVHASDAVPPAYRGDDGTVAVRVPGPGFALDVLCELGEAMAVTSANLSGDPAPTSSDDLDLLLVAQADATVELGPTSGCAVSTVVDCTGACPRILREGAVAPGRVAEAWGAAV